MNPLFQEAKHYVASQLIELRRTEDIGFLGNIRKPIQRIELSERLVTALFADSPGKHVLNLYARELKREPETIARTGRLKVQASQGVADEEAQADGQEFVMAYRVKRLLDAVQGTPGKTVDFERKVASWVEAKNRVLAALEKEGAIKRRNQVLVIGPLHLRKLKRIAKHGIN